MDDPRTALLRLRAETVDPILDSSKGEGATTSPHSEPSLYARQDPQTNDPRSTDNPHEGGGTAGQGQDHHMRDDLRSVPPMTDSLFLLTEDEADTAALDNLSSDYRQFLKEFLNDDF